MKIWVWIKVWNTTSNNNILIDWVIIDDLWNNIVDDLWNNIKY